MRRANIIISIVCILFGAGYAVLIINLPDRNLPNTLGSGFVPWLMFIWFEVLGILLLVRNIFGTSSEMCDTRIYKREAIGIVTFLAVLIGYIKLMKYFGFLVVTPFFVAGLMLLSGSKKWREILLVSVISTFGIYFFFHKLFRVAMPLGNIRLF